MRGGLGFLVETEIDDKGDGKISTRNILVSTSQQKDGGAPPVVWFWGILVFLSHLGRQRPENVKKQDSEQDK